jgi:hypothetical protein
MKTIKANWERDLGYTVTTVEKLLLADKDHPHSRTRADAAREVGRLRGCTVDTFQEKLDMARAQRCGTVIANANIFGAYLDDLSAAYGCKRPLEDVVAKNEDEAEPAPEKEE